MSVNNVATRVVDEVVGTAESIIRTVLTDLTPLLIPIVPSSVFGLVIYQALLGYTSPTVAAWIAVSAAVGNEGFGFMSGQSYFRAIQNGDDEKASSFLYILIVYIAMGITSLWLIEVITYKGDTNVFVLPLLGTMFLLVSGLVYWMLGYRYTVDSADELELSAVKKQAEIAAVRAENERQKMIADAEAAAQVTRIKRSARSAPATAPSSAQPVDTRLSADAYARFAQLSATKRDQLRTIGTQLKGRDEFMATDVCEVLGLSTRQTQYIMKDAKEVGVVDEISRGRYCVNGFDFSKVIKGGVE